MGILWLNCLRFLLREWDRDGDVTKAVGIGDGHWAMDAPSFSRSETVRLPADHYYLDLTRLDSLPRKVSTCPCAAVC